jgi:hypothetical protein
MWLARATGLDTTNALVVSGPIKRRAELAGEIGRTREALPEMVLDLENLDATTLQFEPDFRVKTNRSVHAACAPGQHPVMRPDRRWIGSHSSGRTAASSVTA